LNSDATKPRTRLTASIIQRKSKPLCRPSRPWMAFSAETGSQQLQSQEDQRNHGRQRDAILSLIQYGWGFRYTQRQFTRVLAFPSRRPIEQFSAEFRPISKTLRGRQRHNPNATPVRDVVPYPTGIDVENRNGSVPPVRNSTVARQRRAPASPAFSRWTLKDISLSFTKALRSN
jgi:hypothetical protein